MKKVLGRGKPHPNLNAQCVRAAVRPAQEQQPPEVADLPAAGEGGWSLGNRATGMATEAVVELFCALGGWSPLHLRGYEEKSSLS